MKHLAGLFLVLFGSFFVVVPAQAATLYLDPANPVINRGDTVMVSLRIDTNEDIEECINTIDAVILYDEPLELVDVSRGDSIIPIWVETPVIDNERRQVSLAGGIPNGYCGRILGDPRLTNTIATFVFRAPVPGSGERTANIALSPESSTYLNDGLGTRAATQFINSTVVIRDAVSETIVDPWQDAIANDTIAPEEFSITLARDEFAFNQQYYIVFNTTDKQSGLSHYEILEQTPYEAQRFTFGAANAPWVVATSSPYVLEDQSLRSIIRVKAVDKAGNEYIATLAPQNESLPWYWWVGGGVLALLVVIILFWLLRKVLAKRRTQK